QIRCFARLPTMLGDRACGALPPPRGGERSAGFSASGWRLILTGASSLGAIGLAAAGEREVGIPPLGLGGTLRTPDDARGLVLFAHGSGSSRFSVRNNAVAAELNKAGFATLLLDLLTPDEEGDRRKVFDIP